MKTRARLVSITLSMAMVALGASIGTAQLSGAASSKAPVKVGMILEQTGIYSAYETEWRQGFNIGLSYATNGTDKVNGQKIDVKWDDDADSPTTAASDFKSYVGAGYKIIGGTGDSSIADELAPLAAQNKVLYISGAAADDAITGANRYTFRSGRQTYQDVQTAKSYIKALGTGKTILVLGQDFAFGQSYVTDATSAFSALGDNVQSLLVPLTTTDFTATALQVAQMKPDIIFLAWAGTTGAPLTAALQQQGVFNTAKVVTGLANIATYPFYGSVGTSFNYLSLYVSNGSKNAANEYLIKAMKAKYNQPPDLFTPDGFVWAQMLVRAIQTGQGSNVNAMIKGLAGYSFLAPKGEQTIRASDHAMLQPMYQVSLVTSINNVFSPVVLKTLSAAVTAPPVTTHFSN
ncbi:MAG TPA: substrate-binding domain-containing protein [Acidimicrobiales bacterium]